MLNYSTNAPVYTTQIILEDIENQFGSSVFLVDLGELYSCCPPFWIVLVHIYLISFSLLIVLCWKCNKHYESLTLFQANCPLIFFFFTFVAPVISKYFAWHPIPSQHTLWIQNYSGLTHDCKVNYKWNPYFSSWHFISFLVLFTHVNINL